MYQIKTDTHVHSIFTDHAYSTIEENARYAAEVGMECIAITDHVGPLFINDLRIAVFNINNRTILPRKMHGVTILRGVEMDIVNTKGELAYCDVPHPFRKDQNVGESILQSCELVIASVHPNPTFIPGTKVDHTNMYINAIKNPYVDIIGHSGRSGMEFEIDEVLKAAKEYGKIIEINNHSFDMGRPMDICKTIAERCANLGVSIAVNSDAHCAYSIGHYDNVLKVLEEIHFPEELIANLNEERLLRIIRPNKTEIRL